MAAKSIRILIFGLFFVYAEACVFPSDLRGVWISSEKNELNFTDNILTGFKVSTYNTDNFTCTEQSGTKYVVKSNRVTKFGLNFFVYMCLDLMHVNSDVLTYYRASPQLADAGGERVFIRLTTLSALSAAQVCTVTNYTDLPYSILLRNDSVNNASIECPFPFLGQFQYTYDTGNGNNLCPNGSSLDVCSEKTTMRWNYDNCSQIQAYSAGGVTRCIYHSNITRESDNVTVYTLHVYNMDSITDQKNTYRFTCYRVIGFSTVFATQYPGNCPATMNETFVSSPGAKLFLNATETCPYDTTTTETTTPTTTPIPSTPTTTTTTTTTEAPSGALSAGVIAAIVIIVILIVLIIIVAIVYYYYRKRQQQKQAEWEALNRKVDPDELSPNMRLGLPDESRYDLDRLMYSPDSNTKNSFAIKKSKKDMLVDGLENYNENRLYADENERQSAIDASLFVEKRKRTDKKDEYSIAKPENKVFSDRIVGMSKGRKKRVKRSALAKLKFKPKARPAKGTPGSPTGTDDGGRGTRTKDIVIQVEEAEGDPKRKTRFADEMQNADGADGSAAAKTKDGQDLNANEVKPLDQIETLSDIADNENAVGDLSDDEPRLILPNLRPVKKSKSKRARDRSSHVPNPQSSSMPQRTRFTPAILTRSPTALEEEFSAPMPTMPPASTMHPLVRIHRKENPRAWKDALGDKANGMESMDMDTAKRQLSENRLKRLLEELYTDKKYFDYVKKTTTDTEQNLMQSADKSLDFLYGRAMFWEEKEPIPERPPSHVKRMFSRYEPSKSPTKSLQRSATILSRNGISRNSVHRAPSTGLATRTPSTRKATRTPSLRQNLRTPSTQVSRLKKREQLDKKKKENLNNASKKTSKYLEDSTQTDFSPIPSITPVEGMAIEGNLEAFDTMSLPRSPGIQIDRLSPVMPLQREVTRADIQLEEYDGQEAEYDDLNRDLRYDNQHIDEGPNAVSAV